MIKKLFSLILILFVGAVFFAVMENINESAALKGAGEQYARRGADELGAANLVTAIVVTYRGLDTLGEVTVLFLAATGIAVLLRKKRGRSEPSDGLKRGSSEILRTGADLLTPVIVIFGVYIFINGHLSPGGGFQGGAVIASAVMLLFLAYPGHRIGHTVFGIIESGSGFLYVITGLMGIWFAGGFLDNRILPLGNFGHIMSAGAIPLIYSLIGLKVGTELAGILDNMRRDEE